MTTQQRIIKELHIMGAISEQTALNAKEVAELADTKQAHARLCELRDQGFVIASSRTGKNKYWLTLAGVQAAEKINESKQDQSTDDNLNQANNDNRNSESTDVDDTNVATSQANSDANEFQYPIYKVSKATGLVVKFTDLTVGETIRQGFDEGSIVGVKGKVCKYFPAHNDDKTWADWTPPAPETVAVPESENPYNPQYEMMGSALIDDVVVNNVESFNRLDDVAEKREIPPPQYNPDDVAFKKGDTVFWYTVDGIKEVFETSTDAIHAAQELVKNRKIVATIHAVASKPHAIIKPVVTTELEYV